MKKIILMAILALAAAPLFAQGLRIASVEFDSQGRSSEYILAMKADIRPGMAFPDRAALDAFLADRRQVLLNERVLESVEIAVEESGGGEVAVTVRTKDSWNIVALPYFKFDSNDGLLLSVRGRDYNFLGSMEALRLNLNREQDTSGQSAWSADLEFYYPFPALGLDWKVGASGGVTLPEGGAPARGEAALLAEASMPLPLGRLELSTAQRAYVNRVDSAGDAYGDAFYLRTTAGAAWRIPVALGPAAMAPYLRPRVEWGQNWLPGGLEDGSLDRGPGLTAAFGAGAGRADWRGNFRSGWTASADAAATWYPERGGYARTLSTTLKAYADLGWAGPSARLSAFIDLDGRSQSAGEALRGVLNARAATDAAVSLNADFPVRLINFRPYEWFGKRWMRVFEFEQHWSPFVDAALGRFGPGNDLLAEGWYGAGLEVITFPLIMRSFYVRISLGVDLAAVASTRSLTAPAPRDGKQAYELFFGLGHHY